MIDGGVFIGRNPGSGLEMGEAAFKQHLLKNGLSGAIVSSYKSIFFDDREGNADVLKFYKRQPDWVIPGITLNPLRWDASKDPDYLLAMRDEGAKVLCLFSTPSYYTLNWESPLVSAMVQQAARMGYVIQLGVKNEVELAQVIARFGGLKAPVLIRWMGSAAYRGLTEGLQALLDTKNIYFDIASLTGIGMLRHLTEAVDAKRLYWASNAPEQSVSAARFLLEAAELSSEKLYAVSHASLSDIFTGSGKVSRPAEQYQKKWAAIKKIDTHWHLEHWNLLEPGVDPKTYPSLLKKNNIQKALFSSIRALNGYTKEGNRGVFEYASKNRGVYGLVVVDPTQVAASLSEIKRYATHPRCVGIKTIQDLYGFRLNDPEYQKILRAADEHGLSVMAHLPGLKEAALAYPNTYFIAAHSTWGRVKNLIGVPNIYFDLATSHRQNDETQLAKLVKAAGPDKILFASDAPLMHPAWTMGKISEAGLSPKVLKQIFYDNALKAFPRLAGFKKTKK